MTILVFSSKFKQLTTQLHCFAPQTNQKVTNCLVGPNSAHLRCIPITHNAIQQGKPTKIIAKPTGIVLAQFSCVCEFKLLMQFRYTLVTMSTTSCFVSNIVLVLIVDKILEPKLKLLMLLHDRLSYISVTMYSSTFSKGSFVQPSVVKSTL